MNEAVTLVVQAGGGSNRMGEDKALKQFLGVPLLQRVVDRLAPLTDETLVTASKAFEFPSTNARFVADLIPGCGALGGLYTGLSYASHSIVAVAACDMPFVNVGLFTMAIRRLLQEEVDAVVPRSRFGLEPLHAVYRRDTCLPVIQAAIEQKNLKLTGWFRQVRVSELNPGEIDSVDTSGLAFMNVNTPEDFLLAEKLAAPESAGSNR